ncbi:MAG: FKBP-type peptidyl-prolyl cis-trans isomerase [Gammaproteobacteria bacterium]|jgi:FKBP-type peptidyl-prolyl cis-trans isomerase FklB
MIQNRRIVAPLFLVGLGLAYAVAVAGETPEIKDKKDQVSYSVGYQVGGDLKNQGIDFDPEVLIKGIQDALWGTAPVMTDDAMHSTLVTLKQELVAKQEAKEKQTAEENARQGEAFLAENAKRKGITVLPSGLQYQVLVKGSGPKPKATDTVTVHYRGTLIDGTEFDSSFKRNEPTKLQLDRVIAGWSEALQLMSEGAKWKLFVPAQLAYGERGVGPIPANSTLIFDVELIAVN